jgi:hypothetical protein
MEGEPAPDLPPRFEDARELGSGGMGIVYRAVDRELGRPVAVKVFHDRTPLTFDRIKREFRLAAAVRHPNLVRLGELFEHSGSLCFSMELIEGVDLASWVMAGARADRVRSALVQLAGALAALHRAGVIHRDVKPANVMVTTDDRVVLLDLGLAIPIGGGERELAGTIEYVAPEQLAGGAPTAAVDLYALGVLGFELLTGRTPFEGAPLELLVAKTERDAPLVSTLIRGAPLDLDRLIRSLLERDPSARPTARELELSLGEATAPAPRRRRQTGRLRRELIGRAAELAELLAASESVARRPRTVLYLVRGPTGIGKTALVETLADAARARGQLVALGRCGPREHLRYNAWDALIDALARYLEGVAPVERAALVPTSAVALSRMFPSFERVVDVTSTSSDAVELIEAEAVDAIRAIVSGIARTRAVVSILDDAQWTTAASFALLTETLRAPAPPCLIVFCVRTTAQVPPAMAAQIDRLRGLPIELRVLDLAPLPDDDIGALAMRWSGDPAAARRIVGAAHGNPLYAELLAGEPDSDDDDLGALFRRRLTSLPAGPAQVLRAVVAAGVAVRLGLLGHALAMGHDTLILAVEHLQERGLVRSSGLTRVDTCEVMHDQVVAATEAHWPARADDHRRLALAIEEVEPERAALAVRHWVLAGERERATTAVLELVAGARDVLAMAQAAELCALVLTIAPDEPRLLRRRADALALAGDGDRAADAYLAAGQVSSGAERLDLERLAAEHLLRGGRIDEGTRVARRVAAGLGGDLDLSHASVMSRLTIERVRNRWRGLTLAREPAPGEAALADACASLAAGLSMIDTIRAAWFTSRGVRHALDSGDPVRAARALCYDAMISATRGAKQDRRVRDTLAQARAFLARAARPEVGALIEHAAAVTAMLAGDYRAARHHGELAVASYRRVAAGVSFDQHTAEFFTVVALFWLGDWATLVERRRGLLRAADATDDRFARLCATTGVAVIADLITGADPDELHARLAASAQVWSRARAPATAMRILMAASLIDRYHGHDERALARLEQVWPHLVKARALTVEQVRASLLFVRAGCYVRLGRWSEAAADARAMRSLPSMAGPAALIEAAVERARGGTPLALLGAAIAAAEDAGLAGFVAAARARRGRLLGEDGAGELLVAADDASRLGLGDTERAFALLAPWPE